MRGLRPLDHDRGSASNSAPRVAAPVGLSTIPRAVVPQKAAGPVPTLPQSEREYLWQVEHHGLMLGQIAFLPLAHALEAADSDRLTSLLAGAFQGQVPSHPRKMRFRSDIATVERDQDDGEPPLLLSRDQFVGRLLEYRRELGGRPQVKVSLMSLSSERRPALDGIWLGTCLLRIWGETTAGKPAEVTLILSFRLPQPDESRYAAGGWLEQCGIRQSQVASGERYLMKEVARRAASIPAGSTIIGRTQCDPDVGHRRRLPLRLRSRRPARRLDH